MRVLVKLNRKRAAASSVGRIFCEKIGTHFSGKCQRFKCLSHFLWESQCPPGIMSGAGPFLKML
jgi:hypothetical protein